MKFKNLLLLFFLFLPSFVMASGDCPTGEGLQLFCDGCDDAEDVIDMLNDTLPLPENNYDWSVANLRVILRHRAVPGVGPWIPLNPGAPIFVDRHCGESWDRPVNEAAAWDIIDALLSSIGPGGGAGGGIGWLGGGLGGGFGGGGGGGACYYSDGNPLPGNPSWCPPHHHDASPSH